MKALLRASLLSFRRCFPALSRLMGAGKLVGILMQQMFSLYAGPMVPRRLEVVLRGVGTIVPPCLQWCWRALTASGPQSARCKSKLHTGLTKAMRLGSRFSGLT